MNMIMIKLHKILLTLLAIGFTLTACSDEEPFSTASESDYPRIIDPIFADRVDGALPVISNINRDANFNMTVTVTPADYTTVTWFIDKTEVCTGNTIDLNLQAGTYNLKVVATTTAGLSTSREGLIQVNPLTDDPWSAATGFERIIAPGTTARLYGNNLNLVSSILIGDKVSPEVTYTESEEGNYLTYFVPSDLTAGSYRISLTDNAGNAYGANKVEVVTTAVITSGAERTGSGNTWIMTGINLDQITSLNIGETTITEFQEQSSTAITLNCPELPEGEYTLTGQTANGENVQFYRNEGMTSEQTVVISSEQVLWKGHHYVSWDLPDDNPNKTFNLISKDQFAAIKAGATLKIHYSVEPGDEYHQLRTTTGWWNDLPGTSVIDFSESGVKDVALTQEVLDAIQAEDGFLCVGHGFYVDLISVQ